MSPESSPGSPCARSVSGTAARIGRARSYRGTTPRSVTMALLRPSADIWNCANAALNARKAPVESAAPGWPSILAVDQKIIAIASTGITAVNTAEADPDQPGLPRDVPAAAELLRPGSECAILGGRHTQLRNAVHELQQHPREPSRRGRNLPLVAQLEVAQDRRRARHGEGDARGEQRQRPAVVEEQRETEHREEARERRGHDRPVRMRRIALIERLRIARSPAE